MIGFEGRYAHSIILEPLQMFPKHLPCATTRLSTFSYLANVKALVLFDIEGSCLPSFGNDNITSDLNGGESSLCCCVRHCGAIRTNPKTSYSSCGRHNWTRTPDVASEAHFNDTKAMSLRRLPSHYAQVLPLPGDMGSGTPFPTSLGAGLPGDLVNPPLDQTVVWDTSIQLPLPLPFISEALPAFTNLLPIAFHTGISPNKIFACLISS